MTTMKATRQELERKGWDIDANGRMMLNGQTLFPVVSSKGLPDEYAAYYFDPDRGKVTERRVTAGAIHA